MSDALDCSPKWKKPGDVMKKIYLRKRKIPIRSASLSEVSEFNKGKDNAKSLGVSLIVHFYHYRYHVQFYWALGLRF